MVSRQYFRSRPLKHSLAINIAVGSVVPIIVVSILVMGHLSQHARIDTDEINHLVAHSVSSQVDTFLNTPLIVLQNIKGILSDNPDMQENAVQQILDNHIHNSDLFESIVLLDKEGIVQKIGLKTEQEKFRQDFIGINLAHLDVYKKAVENKKPTWSNTFISMISGKMSLALCLVVDDRALIGNFAIEALADFIQHVNVRNKVQLILVDQNGTIIVHPDSMIAARQVNINNLNIVQAGFAGHEGTYHYSFNRVKYIGNAQLATGPEWLIIASQTENTSRYALLLTAKYFLGGALGAILFAIVFALLKSRQLSQPLSEAAARSKIIAEGNYEVSFSRSPYREVQELTNSFKNMADAVQSREKALYLSEKRFRAIFNATNEAIFIRNIETKQIIAANRSMIEMFGYAHNEISSKTIGDLSGGDQVIAKEKAAEKVYRAIHEGPQIFEWLYCRKNGEQFWAEVTLKTAEVDGAKRLLGVIRDIAVRKKYERQLVQSQKMEAIGTLAGGIAHDFNNILTPIHGYVEMALIMSADSRKVKDNLREVLNAVQRAKDLVQQILTFSRQESQKPAPTNVGIIIKEALKLLRASIPSTIEIRQNIHQHCGAVMVNPTHVHQILINLCTNAYHAMRQTGGILGVVLEPVEISGPDSTGRINLQPGNYLRLEVSDTGKGMEKEILGRIFEPYFTTKEKGEGTGLGLSVVHGIITGLGGDISVYSEPGKGTTFQVYLPVIHGTAPDLLDINDTPPPGGSERILLVDDEKEVLLVEEELLNSLGYHIESFSKPHEALEYFQTKPDMFDLILTDMTMPKMTGDVLAIEILKIRPDIPIILCTGFSEILNKEEALSIGIKDYLNKPIGIHNLALTLRTILDNE